MADFHNYTFYMSGKDYNDGYDRIFGKKEKKHAVQISKTKVVSKKKASKSVQKVGA